MSYFKRWPQISLSLKQYILERNVLDKSCMVFMGTLKTCSDDCFCKSRILYIINLRGNILLSVKRKY